MKELLQVINSIESIIKAITGSTGTISENISNLSATSEEIAAASTEGQQMAEGAVTEMKKAKEVIDATYMLAQDLKNYADKQIIKMKKQSKNFMPIRRRRTNFWAVLLSFMAEIRRSCINTAIFAISSCCTQNVAYL